MDLIVQFILEHLPEHNTALIITGKDALPTQVVRGIVSQFKDLCTTQEDADIIIQQLVKLAEGGPPFIKVVCDDTDVFVLLVL